VPPLTVTHADIAEGLARLERAALSFQHHTQLAGAK